MDHLPSLTAARRLSRGTGARLEPLRAGSLPAADGAIAVLCEPPSERVLAEVSAAVEHLTAVVLWAPGWDEAQGIEALGRHGLEHGTVSIVSVPEPGALCVLTNSDHAARSLRAMLEGRERPFRALAVMPAFNEVDVISPAIGALVSEGVDVYLIDHQSTDGTAEAAAPWLGCGLVHIEHFPDDAGYPERNRHEMVWRDILRRCSEVTGEIPADWYLFVNADEFREAPWPDVTLGEGLRSVDELGYSAVNFELFDFRPTDESFSPGDDPRDRLLHYEPPGRHDLLQVKAWKGQDRAVDLVTHGGHNVLFEGKRVFPVPFILRHYPIRSSEHGRRKVLAERLPRFAAEERAGGWHVQYDGYAAGASFLADPAGLPVWDGDRVRAELLSQSLRDLLLALCLSGADLAGGEISAERLGAWVSRRGAAAAGGSELDAARQRLSAAAGGAPLAAEPLLDSIARHMSLAFEAWARLGGDAALAATLGDARRALPDAA